MRVAILDDYLNVALELGDWSRLDDKADLCVFDQPFADHDEATEKLLDFEIIVGMRERTPFPRRPPETPTETKITRHDGHAKSVFRYGGCKDARRHGLRHRCRRPTDGGVGVGHSARSSLPNTGP